MYMERLLQRYECFIMDPPEEVISSHCNEHLCLINVISLHARCHQNCLLASVEICECLRAIKQSELEYQSQVGSGNSSESSETWLRHCDGPFLGNVFLFYLLMRHCPWTLFKSESQSAGLPPAQRERLMPEIGLMGIVNMKVNDGEAITDCAYPPTDLYKSINNGKISLCNARHQLSQATTYFSGTKIYHSEILKACTVIVLQLQYCQSLTVILCSDTVT